MKERRKAGRQSAAGASGRRKDSFSPRKRETLVAAMKTSLARAVERRRVERKLSQGRLAARLGSSQSRVSKLEAGDPTVSLDLLVRALLATGATRRDVARAIAGS